MQVYFYDKDTKEYTGQAECDKDPLETRKQGVFVPLVPDFATLEQPPQVQVNKARIFENNQWVYISDYRENYKKADEYLNITDIDKLGELEEGFYLVDNATAEDIKENTSHYKISDGAVVKKTNEEIEEEELEQVKLFKIKCNDSARDNVINGGVTYRSILFDSDTDQKVNLLAIVSTMNDEDTITWFGMNNDSLECSKVDLISIGSLITNLHEFCWTKNAQIKAAIAAAQTVEEVEAIEINYLDVE